jgi:hypothetical protein
MKTFFSSLLSLAILVGCTTSQQTTAFKTIASTDATVTTANDGYQSLVIKGVLPTNSLPQVSHIFNQIKADELIALDAVQFQSNALAPANLVIESQNFVKVINTIKATAK